MFFIFLMYAMFATSFTFGKFLVGFTNNTIFLNGIRMTIAGALLLIYQYGFAKHAFVLRRKDIKYFLLTAMFGPFLSYILRFIALNQNLSSGKACLFYNLSPFATALFTYFMLSEKIGWKKWLGLIIGFVGMFPELVSSAPLEDLFWGSQWLSIPELLMMISVFSHSFSWLILQKLVKNGKYAPMMVNGVCMFLGGVASLIMSLLVEDSLIVENSQSFIISMAGLILVSNIISHSMFATLLKKYSATFLSFAGFITPFFAAFYGWIFLGETIGKSFYLSAAAVFIGMYLFYKEEVSEKHPTAMIEID